MKKFLITVMALVLCLSICACSTDSKKEDDDLSKEDIEKITHELNGSSWMTPLDDSNIYTAWAFDYGLVAVMTNADGITFGEEQGTFEVKDDCIALTWDDPDCGRSEELYYTFKNDELKLYTDEDKEDELICVRNKEGHDKIDAE